MAPDTLERPTLDLADPSLLRQQCHVDGAWVAADNGTTMPVVDPATGELVGTAPMFGAAETKRAIEAAHRAYPAWRAKTAKERSAVLRTWLLRLDLFVREVRHGTNNQYSDASPRAR